MCRWNIILRREWHAIGDEVVPFERAAANFVRDRMGVMYACACVVRLSANIQLRIAVIDGAPKGASWRMYLGLVQPMLSHSNVLESAKE